MAESPRRAARSESARLHHPSQAPGLIEPFDLIGDHRRRGLRFQNASRRIEEGAQEISATSAALACAPPHGEPEIAPVRTVPAPVLVGDLALRRGRDRAPAQSERGLGHLQRLVHFLAQEIPQRRFRHALDDLPGQQQSHALVFYLRAGLEQQLDLARSGDEILERRVPLSQSSFSGNMSGRPELCVSRCLIVIRSRSPP